MKVGFFGNTNNYPFTLARAMRRLGHDVLFIVDRPEPLNRPESRYPDISVPYPEWIVDESPLDLHVPLHPPPAGRARAIELLRGCDAVVLNMLGPSLLPEIRRPAIVMLTGSDLEFHASFGFVPYYLRAVQGPFPGIFSRRIQHYARDALSLFLLVSAQRAGIRKATAVNYFARGFVESGDALLEKIGVPDRRRMFFIMTDLQMIRPLPPPRNPVVRIFSVARLTWKPPGRQAVGSGLCSELDYKGSDIMVRGLGMFVRKAGIPIDIRFVKKGRNVEETVRLVEEEGFSGRVTWLGEMTQKGVLEEYAQADIVFDQLGNAVLGMGGVDAMASGRPVIANTRPEIMNRVFGAPLPICQASNPEEVCMQLMRLVFDPAERERVGRASREFAEEHFSPEGAARTCLERLGSR
jgi:glycosyltransferase involved in cell wall biosynthesis